VFIYGVYIRFHWFSVGIPAFRTEVMYIPQRPSLLPRAPRDFVLATMSFYSRRKAYGSNKGELSEEEIEQALEGPMHAGQKLGIGKELWERDWAELSGGEGQRIMLAIGTSLGTADILLFDGMRRLVHGCMVLIVR
jgi:ABC-type iron transport system FetAB ATPase subunit